MDSVITICLLKFLWGHKNYSVFLIKGLLGSDGEQSAVFKPVLEGMRILLHFPLVLMNRLNKPVYCFLIL